MVVAGRGGFRGREIYRSSYIMIQVNHVNKEAFKRKMKKYPYNGCNSGHPFLLVIHEEETLADNKLRLHEKFQVPDDEFFKWKSARGKYFQDSDMLFHHFEREVRTFPVFAWSTLPIPGKELLHQISSKRTSLWWCIHVTFRVPS